MTTASTMIRHALRAVMFAPVIMLAFAGTSTLSACASSRTDEPALIPRSVFFGNPDKAMVKVSPDGTKVYTANGPSGDVSVVDLSTGTVERKIATGGSPWGLAMK